MPMALRGRGQPPPPACCLAAVLVLVLLALQAAAAAAAGTLSMEEEGAVLRTLRQRLADTGLTPNGRHGWQPDDPHPHCSWRCVSCNIDGHVSVVDLEWVTVPPPGDEAQRRAAPLLLPELARFGALSKLALGLYYAPPVAAIPAQWGLPGAFPVLQELQLKFPTIEGPLPDIHPGALPRLTSLHIEASNRTTGVGAPPLRQNWGTAAMHNISSAQDPAAARRGKGLRSVLPASWGASPDVLPALRELTLVLQMVPPLPAGWARGFCSLRRLLIAAPVDAPMPAADGNVLPPEWAAGFLLLRWLNFLRLGLTGSFPAAWEEGFPLLTELSLTSMALSGALPQRIFESHIDLKLLTLDRNNFTGTLPAAWAASQSLEGLSLQHNRLSGPLFPPAWLALGALPRLKYLVLSHNAGLAGSLPATLPWPMLASLDLNETQVTSPSIPASWCKSPNAAVFGLLSLPDPRLGEELPSCLHKAMPTLTIVSHDHMVIHVGRVAAQAPLRGSRAAVAIVLLALLALAGVAGLALRRRRVHTRPAGGLHKNSAACGAGLLSGTEAGELKGPPHKDSQPAPGTGCSQTMRIERLLQSQLSQSRQRIELVPLARLPKALAHQLGSLRRGSRPTAAAGMPGAAYSRLRAVDEEQQHSSWGSFESSSGSGGGTEGLLEAGAARPPASRQWGLETDSLRLTAGELEMQTAPDGTLCLLGEGSSSTVYLGRLGSYEDVAVKVVELCPGMDSRHVWHEVSLLRACVHRRLVALLGVACQGQLLMLVMELMQGGDLHSALQRPATRDALRWAARGRQVALDVAEALAFLHSCGVQHADLKPSNVLLTPDLRAKLTDLGVAQQLGSRSRRAVGGTTQYAAPEQLLGLPCTTKADVYSLGVLLTVLCTGRSLAARGQLCLPSVPDDCPQPVLELIQECICPDPARRPTAEEALRRLRDC